MRYLTSVGLYQMGFKPVWRQLAADAAEEAGDGQAA